MIHWCCISNYNGKEIYIDVRGTTTNYNEFLSEFQPDMGKNPSKKKIINLKYYEDEWDFPLLFPIYDSFVEKILIYFKREDKFAEFTKKELKNYTKFKDVLIEFKKFYNIDQYHLKDIDRYLWQLGKDYFPKKYKK